MLGNWRRVECSRMDDQATTRESGRMKYRKLRIGWSVGWGLLCLSVVGLWIRCLFVGDFGGGLHAHVGTMRVSKSRVVSLSTLNGNCVITCSPRGSASPNNFQATFPHAIANYPKVKIPFSSITFIVAGLGFLPWLSFRFGLRTLLTSMTLFAVGLGWAVYMFRQ
jgi:hypothetical protein